MIAIDILLQSIKDNRKLDVFGTVYRLRRHRLNMVQREVIIYLFFYFIFINKKNFEVENSFF